MSQVPARPGTRGALLVAILLPFLLVMVTGGAHAGIDPEATGSDPAAAGTRTGSPDELEELHGAILRTEGFVMEHLHSRSEPGLSPLARRKEARDIHARLQELIQLRRQERELGNARLARLEDTISGLEGRRETLASKIRAQQAAVRKFLIAIEGSTRQPLQGTVPAEVARESLRTLQLPERERHEAPRRRLLANLTRRSLQELEMLRVDMEDAGHLEEKINDERQQLAYLIQDLDENESVLELSRQLQADLYRQRHQERLVQLENYRRLKSSQAQVDQLLTDFNARLELERASDAQKALTKALTRPVGDASFVAVKGNLQLPVADGKVISGFGKAFDPRSRLYIFKKGIDILAGKLEPVRAIFPGRVAFSGELPDYGQVTIIDHGDHYYSLCAHLGKTLRREGEQVAAGDPIGTTDPSGAPMYFEIRSRNVAVNPLQWLDSSISLE